LFYLKAPAIPAAFDRALKPLRTVLENKYYMDWFNENVLAAGARLLGTGCGRAVTRRDRRRGGQRLGARGGCARRRGALVQTGHLYWYALVMVLGIFGFMTWRCGPSWAA
jgi:NADH-quinone oxidoreductase subunit L